jgi:hypothetical protein
MIITINRYSSYAFCLIFPIALGINFHKFSVALCLFQEWMSMLVMIFPPFSLSYEFDIAIFTSLQKNPDPFQPNI